VSYDLVFWRYATGDRRDPRNVFDDLMGGGAPSDVGRLPIDEILAALVEAHAGAVREPSGPGREWVDWVASDGRSSFQVEWSDRHLVVFCRGASDDDMNRIIDIVSSFGCPLYDPQTSERFDCQFSA